MYRIIEGRATGKTSRLMLLAKETGATIVCRNPEQMYHKAVGYGIVGIDFISYGDYCKKGTDPDKKYLIDEMELMIKHLFNGQLIGYSISNED